jgi:hypothetical protein
MNQLLQLKTVDSSTHTAFVNLYGNFVLTQEVFDCVRRQFVLSSELVIKRRISAS